MITSNDDTLERVVIKTGDSASCAEHIVGLDVFSLRNDHRDIVGECARYKTSELWNILHLPNIFLLLKYCSTTFYPLLVLDPGKYASVLDAISRDIRVGGSAL